MPSPSKISPVRLSPTVWNKIEMEVNRRATLGQDIVALHIGDTHLPFPNELLIPCVSEKEDMFLRLNRYSNTYGEPHLREMILKKVAQRNLLPVDDIDTIQITAGATGALYAGFSRLIEPEKEILTLAPYWSILRQVADAAKVRLVEVPFFNILIENPDLDIISHLEKYYSSKTAGIYINTPSNPTGMLLKESHLTQILDFARYKDLWIFSDEAYEDYIWDDNRHISIGSLLGGFERTVSIFTFSKCFGSSGIRIGYCVAPPHIISQINRGVVGSGYQAGRLGQHFAWRGMMNFERIVNKFRTD